MSMSIGGVSPQANYQPTTDQSSQIQQLEQRLNQAKTDLIELQSQKKAKGNGDSNLEKSIQKQKNLIKELERQIQELNQQKNKQAQTASSAQAQAKNGNTNPEAISPEELADKLGAINGETIFRA